MEVNLPRIATHHANDYRVSDILSIKVSSKNSKTPTLPAINNTPKGSFSKKQEKITKSAIDKTNSVPLKLKTKASENKEVSSEPETPIVCQSVRISHRRVATMDNDGPQAAVTHRNEEKTSITHQPQAKKQKLIEKTQTSPDGSGTHTPIDTTDDKVEESTDFFRLTGKTKDTLQKYEKYLNLCNFNEISKLEKIESMRKKLYQEHNRSRNYSIASSAELSLKHSPRNPLKFQFNFAGVKSDVAQVIDQDSLYSELKTPKIPKVLLHKDTSKLLSPKSLDVKPKLTPIVRISDDIDDELDVSKRKAIEETFQNRFKKIEKVKYESKALEAVLVRSQFVLAKRDKERIKLEQEEFLAKVRKENEHRRKIDELIRRNNMRKVTSDVEEVYRKQNEQMEQLINNFKTEFNIVDD